MEIEINLANKSLEPIGNKRRCLWLSCRRAARVGNGEAKLPLFSSLLALQ